MLMHVYIHILTGSMSWKQKYVICNSSTYFEDQLSNYKLIISPLIYKV